MIIFNCFFFAKYGLAYLRFTVHIHIIALWMKYNGFLMMFTKIMDIYQVLEIF